MCGMCGAVAARDDAPIDRAALLAMRDALAHRGPDDAGMYCGRGVALGSRRLAILDLSPRGHMPMSTNGGRFWITYNGEVYNYRELRRDLEARGKTFHSNTDTEVLLALFAADGPSMLDRLNGMFAIAIWDAREQALFLARDRLGIKPLYYATQGDTLYFASEEKALFAAGVPMAFDDEAWEELLIFRFVAGDRTVFRGVRQLLPGHWLRWKGGAIQIRRWWHLPDRVRALRDQRHPPVEWFRETFDDAVRLRRISDVPVGVLLSGGLDSSSVAATLSMQAGPGVASFTMRFLDAGYDEGPVARDLAMRWGLDHHELWVRSDELVARLRRASGLNDKPLAHASDLHILAIAEYAKPRVTVLLSGEGADETLGGYLRYQPLRYPAMLETIRLLWPAPLTHAAWRIAKLGRFLKLGSLDRWVLYDACDTLPDDLAELSMPLQLEFPYREQVAADARGLYPHDSIRQAMYSDHHTFLRSLLDRNDRMTMGASIECRVPFLDYRLVEGLAALPTPTLLPGLERKALLRRAFRDRLPRAVRRHRKWGFGVPWARYLREHDELGHLVRMLPDVDPVRDGPIPRGTLRQVIRAFLAGNTRHHALIAQLAMIVIWFDEQFRRSPSRAREPAATHIPRP